MPLPETVLSAPIGGATTVLPVLCADGFAPNQTLFLDWCDAQQRCWQEVALVRSVDERGLGVTRGFFRTDARSFPAGTRVTKAGVWD